MDDPRPRDRSFVRQFVYYSFVKLDRIFFSPEKFLIITSYRVNSNSDIDTFKNQPIENFIVAMIERIIKLIFLKSFILYPNLLLNKPDYSFNRGVYVRVERDRCCFLNDERIAAITRFSQSWRSCRCVENYPVKIPSIRR